MSSDLLGQMSTSHADKAFYSKNFGINNNWCLACIPRPTRCRNPGFVKFKLLIMRKPAYWASVTMGLSGTYEWTTFHGVRKTCSLAKGKMKFTADNRETSQSVRIMTREMEQIVKLKFRMTIRVMDIGYIYGHKHKAEGWDPL